MLLDQTRMDTVRTQLAPVANHIQAIVTKKPELRRQPAYARKPEANPTPPEQARMDTTHTQPSSQSISASRAQSAMPDSKNMQAHDSPEASRTTDVAATNVSKTATTVSFEGVNPSIRAPESLGRPGSPTSVLTRQAKSNQSISRSWGLIFTRVNPLSEPETVPEQLSGRPGSISYTSQPLSSPVALLDKEQDMRDAVAATGKFVAFLCYCPC